MRTIYPSDLKLLTDQFGGRQSRNDEIKKVNLRKRTEFVKNLNLKST